MIKIHDYNTINHYVDFINKEKIVLNTKRKWTINQKLYLLDSVSKNYPIGELIFEEVQRKSDNFKYFELLKGNERLSVIYNCFGTKSSNNIVYDLKSEKFIYSDTPEFYQIDCWKLQDAREFYKFQKSLPENKKKETFIESYEKISLSIQNYTISGIYLYNATGEDTYQIIERFNNY